MTGLQFPAKGRNFLFAAASGPALEPTHLTIRWVRG